jgi:hypothetical protein
MLWSEQLRQHRNPALICGLHPEWTNCFTGGRTKEYLETGEQADVKQDRLIPSSHQSTKPGQDRVKLVWFRRRRTVCVRGVDEVPNETKLAK